MIRLLAVCLMAAAYGQTSVRQLLENKLLGRIAAYDATLNGALGVAAIDLTTGRTLLYHGDAVFPTASSIKIPIMAEMFHAAGRGEFKLTDSVTLKPSDSVGGSGLLQRSLTSGDVRLTVHELITAMIENSDNTATNRCIAMAKMDRINALITELGFHAIRLRRIMMDTGAAKRNYENTASPAEMARLVEMLYRGRLGDANATEQMIAILKRVKANMRAALPPEIPVASKPGDLPGVECESGIVYLPGRPFVLSIFSTFLEGDVHPVRDITKMFFDFYSKLAASNDYGNRVR